MASKNFPRKIKADRYIKIIKRNCLYVYKPIKINHLINEMNNYCLINFGSPRLIHPLTEITNGWMNNIEGQWSSGWFARYNSYIFWFKNIEDKVLFNLTFFDG